MSRPPTRLVLLLAIIAACGSGDTYDFDSDGSVDADDCAPEDPTIHPGADDVFGDDIDANCDGVDGVLGADVLDVDDDGSVQPDDCDDGDATIYPGAPEVPDNGVDEDCNGTDTVTCLEDLDGDDFGSEETVLDSDGDCDDADAGQTLVDGDCDDGNPGIHPDADDVAENGVDEDCNGVDAVFCLNDADSDEFGDDLTVVTVAEGDCDLVSWATDVGGDCDDTDQSAHPGADEYCNGTDNDCDGEPDSPDPQDATTWYPDTDADGFGDDSAGVASCDQIPDWTAQGGDCDDGEATISPNATEVCDGADNDCDGDIDAADSDLTSCP